PAARQGQQHADQDRHRPDGGDRTADDDWQRQRAELLRPPDGDRRGRRRLGQQLGDLYVDYLCAVGTGHGIQQRLSQYQRQAQHRPVEL
ncbi:hypothetical protein OY671_011929, partial [Metschnikowia pulcherrima]